MTDTEKLVAELRELLAKATSDPIKGAEAWSQKLADTDLLVGIKDHLPTLLDALTAAQQEIARLREALGPFARAVGISIASGGDTPVVAYLSYADDAEKTISLNALDIARKALEPSGETR